MLVGIGPAHHTLIGPARRRAHGPGTPLAGGHDTGASGAVIGCRPHRQFYVISGYGKARPISDIVTSLPYLPAP